MSHPYGILGWTGLVGQTLFHQLVKTVKPTDIATYNSKNLQEIRGATFGTLYICYMPATKWWVNLHPAEDKAVLENVLEVLETVHARRVFLISTVDVLQCDQGGESSQVWAHHPYGQHRKALETWVAEKWPCVSHILRLPALFGRGLKKNALYDLLHNNQIHTISLDAQFQWYNLARLLRDCETLQRLDIRLQHMVSPPISMREIAEQWFPEAASQCRGTTTTRYNLVTEYGGTSEGSYIVTKAALFAEMGTWIAWERWRITHEIAASNIGFTMSADTATVLRHVGITALEVAPTRGTDFADFPPVSMQSLLYGIPIANVFQSPHVFLVHLQNLMVSAAKKGIRTFVFGSPKQRDLGDVSWLDAIDLFRRVGDMASRHGITVCIEPNARAYECKWLNTAADVLRFIEAVQHPHIRLSLDSGNYAMEGDVTDLSAIPLEWIGHVQISAAHLKSHMDSVERGTARHMMESLWRRGYTSTISYEAREPAGGMKEYCWGLGQFMDVLESAYFNHHSLGV